MKVEGAPRLMRQLRALPVAQRKHVSDAIAKSGKEGARLAARLAPEVEGDLKESIRVKTAPDGMSAKIIAGEATKRGQIKAHTVEGGRGAETRGGYMAAAHYLGTARKYLAKRHKSRIARAIRKAAKEVAARG